MKTFTKRFFIAMVCILSAAIAYSQQAKSTASDIAAEPVFRLMPHPIQQNQPNLLSGILYDNGPFVTHPGGGPGGSDYSLLENPPLSTYGFGCQKSIGNRLADDFAILSGSWEIDSIVVFMYQTGTTTASTITEVNLQIWNGEPDIPGSVVIWGDATTNRMIRTAWTNCYRGNDLINTTRPIMRCVCHTPGLSLASGTYWIDWQADGNATYTGPWNPPITIIGQTTTGNAIQYTTSGWAPALSDVYNQGMPFLIYGPSNAPEIIVTPDHFDFALVIDQVDTSYMTIHNAGNANLNYNLSIQYLKKSPTWLYVNTINGVVPPIGSDQVIVVANSSGLPNDTYNANILVNSDDPVNPQVIVPVTLDVITFIPGQETTSILIFPNPVNGFLNISSGSMIQNVLLINNLGQTVYQKDYQTKSIRLNTQELKSGIYTLQLKTALGTIFKKIIVR